MTGRRSSRTGRRASGTSSRRCALLRTSRAFTGPCPAESGDPGTRANPASDGVTSMCSSTSRAARSATCTAPGTPHSIARSPLKLLRRRPIADAARRRGPRTKAGCSPESATPTWSRVLRRRAHRRPRRAVDGVHPRQHPRAAARAARRPAGREASPHRSGPVRGARRRPRRRPACTATSRHRTSCRDDGRPSC